MAGHHECLPSASHTRYDDAIEPIDGHAGTDGRTRLIVGRRASARDIFAALPIGGFCRIATQFGCAAGSARSPLGVDADAAAGVVVVGEFGQDEPCCECVVSCGCHAARSSLSALRLARMAAMWGCLKLGCFGHGVNMRGRRRVGRLGRSRRRRRSV